MRMYDIIDKKRLGEKLSKEEIAFFVDGYTNGSIPDYQASALLMAIAINGMDVEETTELTLLMAKSGEMLDLSAIKGVNVDKHSSGGVGDKTTLIIAPMVATLGIPVAKMSIPAVPSTSLRASRGLIPLFPKKLSLIMSIR